MGDLAVLQPRCSSGILYCIQVHRKPKELPRDSIGLWLLFNNLGAKRNLDDSSVYSLAVDCCSPCLWYFN